MKIDCANCGCEFESESRSYNVICKKCVVATKKDLKKPIDKKILFVYNEEKETFSFAPELNWINN